MTTARIHAAESATVPDLPPVMTTVVARALLRIFLADADSQSIPQECGRRRPFAVVPSDGR